MELLNIDNELDNCMISFLELLTSVFDGLADGPSEDQLLSNDEIAEYMVNNKLLDLVSCCANFRSYAISIIEIARSIECDSEEFNYVKGKLDYMEKQLSSILEKRNRRGMLPLSYIISFVLFKIKSYGDRLTMRQKAEIGFFLAASYSEAEKLLLERENEQSRT